MEKEINIAEILKDKPKGTKLYADAFGELSLEYVEPNIDNSIYVNTKMFSSCSFYSDGKYIKDGEPILVPSKEMRDWSKFAWKKGDVLISNDRGREVIFDRWYDITYTSFYAKHYLNSENENNIVYVEDSLCTTEIYSLEDNNAAQCYINTIEKRLGGKLNRETLEIEKPQPEFKDGDVITIMPHIGDKFTYLFKTEDDEKYYGHAYLDGNIAIINEDSYCQKDFCTARPSTEKEKQQLFDALAKDGKQWNAEKKVIEDIKKEYQFEPFEKVLTRDSKDSLWHIDLYEGMLGDDNEYNYSCMAADWVYCIPYEGNEQLLGTTKDVEEDYEGNQE